MAKQVLGDFTLPDEGDIIDQVAGQQDALQVKERTDFLGLLAGWGFEVKRTGRGYMTCCPFHEDKTPSCSIEPVKKLFHCFGCGKKGDVIDFVRYYCVTDFKGALGILQNGGRIPTVKRKAAGVMLKKSAPTTAAQAATQSLATAASLSEPAPQTSPALLPPSASLSASLPATPSSLSPASLSAPAAQQAPATLQPPPNQATLTPPTALTQLPISASQPSATLLQPTSTQSVPAPAALPATAPQLIPTPEPTPQLVTKPALTVQLATAALTAASPLSAPVVQSVSAAPTAATPLPVPAAPRAQAVQKPATTLDLTRIAASYHDALATNRKAREYLKARGLADTALWKRFRLGYSEGKLAEKISAPQLAELKALGLIRESGREHFSGCITVPVFDDGNTVVGMYGRSVRTGAGLPHLYLPGSHRSVFNRKASRIYDSILLTESILDALSLIACGIENVQALYGTGGFTAEHLQLLTDDRVKEVILALDNDHAGREAADVLTEKLLAADIAVKVIFPQAKDWNEELCGSDPAGLGLIVKQRIADAVQLAASGRLPELYAEKKGGDYWFKTEGIVYRLTKLKELFVSNLKVVLMADLEDPEKTAEPFYDTLDLYSSRARETFSAKLAVRFTREPRRIEKDLVAMLQYLEDERDRKLETTATGEDRPRLTDEQKAPGYSFLESPALFEQIVEDMTQLGYVSEDTNKLLVYLSAVSRFLAKPLNIYIQAASSGGKSALLGTLEKLLPPEDVWKATSISPQALHYVDDSQFLDKVFIMGEDIHDEKIEGLIRQMQSEGEISRLVAVKDEKTGQTHSRLICKQVKMAFMVTSTALELNPENASRCLTLHVDETAAQTRHVQERLAYQHSYEWKTQGAAGLERIIAKHRAAQQLLEPVRIFNPLWKHIGFPKIRPAMRRAYEQFLTLIDVICFLRQRQKEAVAVADPAGGREVRGIECDLTDYRLAYRLFTEGVLKTGGQDIPAGSRNLYEEIRRMVRSRGEREKVKTCEVSFLQKQLREYTGLGAEFIKKHLRLLVAFEYLQVSSGRQSGTRHVYRLREDKPIAELDLAELVSPGEMEQLLAGEKKQVENRGGPGTGGHPPVNLLREKELSQKRVQRV